MRTLIIYISLFSILRTNAQSIKENEVFPFQTEMTVKNFKKNKITLSELKGKHLIIDIFISGCVVCFKNFPKMNEFQNNYYKQLQILLIGRLDATIAFTYERFEKKYNLKLPVIFDSSIVRKMGIESFPCYIWVDSNGIVKAITGPEEITKTNIELFLSNRKIVRSIKYEKILFDNSKLFLLNGNGGDDSAFLFRSILTGWKPEQQMILPLFVDHSKNIFQVLGATRDQLYKYAFAGANFWSPGNILYENFYPFPLINDNDSLCIPNTDDPRFCYSILLPKSTQQDSTLLKTMQQDLERFFNIEARTERREMPIWNLIKLNDDTLKYSTKYKKYSGVRTHAGIDLKCYPISELVRFLHYNHPFEFPIINKTGIFGLIDIKIDAIISDFKDLKIGLRNAGFDLVEGKREMSVIVYGKK